jgi:hypothetical protein
VDLPVVLDARAPGGAAGVGDPQAVAGEGGRVAVGPEVPVAVEQDAAVRHLGLHVLDPRVLVRARDPGVLPVEDQDVARVWRGGGEEERGLRGDRAGPDEVVVADDQAVLAAGGDLLRRAAG